MGFQDLHPRRAFVGVAALVAVVAAGSAAGRVHTVERGDTLSKLAQRYGISISTLAEANGIDDPDLILAGSELSVPEAGAAESASATAATPPVGDTRSRLVAVPPSRAGLRPVFTEFARIAGVPADLAMGLAWQESGWQVHRVSSTGAVGVMQLMPATVDFVSRILLRQSANLDPHDPAANIRMGTRFLRYLLDRTGGDVDTALASYYQGLRSVRERGVFSATERFVANVKALRQRF